MSIKPARSDARRTAKRPRPTQRFPEVSPYRQFQALLRQNFGAFTERCFNELLPAHDYLHNWHLEALAYYLGEVMAGRCQRLLITSRLVV